MKEEKFTQGEWVMGERQASCCGFDMYCFFIMANHEIICLSKTVDQENIPKMQANANLIAAAPEMYEILKLVKDELGSGFLVMEIDKVLKKARGEE